MAEFSEKTESLTFPMAVLRDIVAFPSEILNTEISARSRDSIRAVQAAAEDSGYFLLAAVDPADEDAQGDNIFEMGTVAKIKQLAKTAEGGVRLVADVLSRAEIVSVSYASKYYSAEVVSKTITIDDLDDPQCEAYKREMIFLARGLINEMPSIAPPEIISAMQSMKNPAQIADLIASRLLSDTGDKLKILATFEPFDRMEKLIPIMKHELEILEIEASIHKRTQLRISNSQKEHFLREKMKAIQEELGDTTDSEEYSAKIKELNAPREVKDKLLKENDKLSRASFGSADATVISNYLDVCLEIPWRRTKKECIDIERARDILDRDHDGLEDVKQRFLEYLATKSLSSHRAGQIMCLYGPPGVGKTSLAASLAKAMGREYVRISLGGIRDEADIRGHRKTYVGAMPGRIIDALISAKCNNPLILLDEIDKISYDGRGNPASALLEVLDPEQNKYFRDHFVELPFDLSNCMFIATANTLDTIEKPLMDRMEIIELHAYTKSEKMSIAKNHLIPRQLDRNGLNKSWLRISDSALSEIIDSYTREAGVRNLEREIAKLCRRVALSIVETKPQTISVSVTRRNLEEFLGAKKIPPQYTNDRDEIGTVNGLAYTQSGGELLIIEVAVTDGTGKLELTGSLGDVMKESAKAALTYARTIAHKYDIPTDFYSTRDIHIHVPEGAIPKDGPSAGVTILTALISALSKIPVRHDIAMTGEITLLGRVLPIGGLREKTMAAYSAGIKTVLIPYDNMNDINELDSLVRENITFVPCRTAADVLSRALAVNNSQTGADADAPADAGKKKTSPRKRSGNVQQGQSTTSKTTAE